VRSGTVWFDVIRSDTTWLDMALYDTRWSDMKRYDTVDMTRYDVIRYTVSVETMGGGMVFQEVFRALEKSILQFFAGKGPRDHGRKWCFSNACVYLGRKVAEVLSERLAPKCEKWCRLMLVAPIQTSDPERARRRSETERTFFENRA
jgi:hypothetical protein